VKQQPPKANSLFPLSFFFHCSICSPKERDNTPIRSTPAAHPLHNNFHCCLRLSVDCCVCSPNVISMKPSTSSNTLLHTGQFLLFSMCATIPVSCLPVPLPDFLPLPLVIRPGWLLHCHLCRSWCHWVGDDTPMGLTGDWGASACSDNFFYYHAGAAKIERVAQPLQPRHNSGSTCALGCLLGEGASKQRGGINAIGGWVLREAMHAREMAFFYASCVLLCTGFRHEKTQVKNWAMQRHWQVLPPCRCIARIDAGE
jgi:hypothetical protein